VRAARGVLIGDLRQPTLVEARGQLHQRRPHAAVYISDFALDQLTHQNVRVLGNATQELEDLVTLGVPPPAPLDRFARDVFRKARHRTARGLQHNAVLLHEFE